MHFCYLFQVCFMIYFNLSHCLKNALEKDLNDSYNPDFDRASQCFLDFISGTPLPKTQILLTSETIISHSLVTNVLQSFHRQDKYWISLCTIESGKCDISGLNSNRISYTILSDSDELLQILFASNNKILTMTTSQINVIVSHRVNISQTLQMTDENYLYNAVVAVYNNNNNSLSIWRSKARCKRAFEHRLNFTFLCYSKQLVGFKDISYNDLRKCHLRIGVREKLPFMAEYVINGIKSKYLGLFEFVGVEISFLFEVIGELSNVQYIRGSSSELINKLAARELDMMIGALPAITDVPFIEALYPHLHAKLIAVVKRRYPNQILQIANVLSAEFSISFFVISLLLITIIYLCKWHTERKRPDLSGIILYFFGITVGRAQPSDKYKNFRILWLLWVWVSFFFRCAIEILLIILLANSNDVPQIKYLAELCDGTTKVFTTEDYRPYFRGGIPLTECTIMDENIYYLENPVKALDESNLEDKNALFMLEDEFKMLVTSNLKDFSKLPFWSIPEPVLYAPLSYYFHQGDPLAAIFSKRAEFIKSRGWLKFYEREATRLVNNKYLKLFGYSVLFDKKSDIISLDQMHAFLLQWAQGVLASIVVFVIEIIINRL